MCVTTPCCECEVGSLCQGHHSRDKCRTHWAVSVTSEDVLNCQISWYRKVFRPLMFNFSRLTNVIGAQFLFQSASAVLLRMTTSLSLAPLSYSYLRAGELVPSSLKWSRKQHQLPKPQLKSFNAECGAFSLWSFPPKVGSTPGRCRITALFLLVSAVFILT